jgi:hypothetical protein
MKQYMVTVTGFGHTATIRVLASNQAEAYNKAAAKYGVSVKVGRPA